MFFRQGGAVAHLLIIKPTVASLKNIQIQRGNICEPIEKIADEYIDYVNIPEGDFDNVSKCRYTVPDHWTIGKVYQRLIEDTLTGDDLTTHVIRVYHSWVSDGISDYNTDFYYQPRGYISLCYKEDKLIA